MLGIDITLEMNPEFDKISFPIPCPNCHQKTDKTIAWMKQNSHFTCSGCGARIRLKADEIINIQRTIEKSFKQAGFKPR